MIKFLVQGDYACFTRPEMKVERVSYDVPTPSAIRGIIESIYWKPAIKFLIDTIYVINPIKFANIRRNEIKSKISPQKMKAQMDGKDVDPSIVRGGDEINQRGSRVLKDVCYGIEAHFEYTSEEDNNDGKHLEIFNRRLKGGQYFKKPVLGCREFPAKLQFVEEFPKSQLEGVVDIGYMLYDMKYEKGKKVGEYSNCAEAMFYRPIMIDGKIDVAKYAREGGLIW